MQIDGKVLLSFLGSSNLASVGLDTKQHRSNLIFITRRFYCTPMTISGNCPRECSACRATIVTQFDHFRGERAKNPAALWTWLKRQALADVLEHRQQKAAGGAQAVTVDGVCVVLARHAQLVLQTGVVVRGSVYSIRGQRQA